MIDHRILAILLTCLVFSLPGCRGVDVLNSKARVLNKRSAAVSETIRQDLKASVGETTSKKTTTEETPTITDDDGETDSEADGTIQQVRYQSPVQIETSSYPIDFPTVLRLAGADNWNVQLARQRVSEAAANYCAAKSEWMPSLTLSVGFNNHEGELQATEGDVLTVSRNSLFVGGGAGIQNSPLNGGSGGPPRMFVDFSLADAIFKPLSARRLLGAEQARRNRVFNDTMLEASLAYYELVRAQSQLAISQTNLQEAHEVANLTSAFVQAGKGTSADNSRIAVIVNNRQQQVVIAEAELRIASAQLATILQLDPSKLNPEMGLVALDADPIPLNLTGVHFDLNTTIQQAQNLRCEIAEANARTHSAQSQMMAEQWRPWLPNLYLGYSGGVFGGGTGGDIPSLDGRSDLDVVVSWQVKNLGVGTRAQQDATRSRMYQRNFETQQIRDQIAEQVTTTHQRVLQFQSMVGLLATNIQEAGSGLEKNLVAIKGLEGLPLEAISSLDQLAKSRTDYLAAVVNYNQWQVRLLRAAGQSLAADAELGTVANCNANGCDVSIPECSACFQKPSQCRCNRAAPIRTFGNKLARGRGCNGSCDQGCDSCGSDAQFSNPIGHSSGYFQSDSCTDGRCGSNPNSFVVNDKKAYVNAGIGTSFLDGFSPTQRSNPRSQRRSPGSPARLAWYEESDSISR